MILCHERKLLFLKTRKTGSTSFEIALSAECGPRDIITPLAEEDEILRTALGHRGAQNHMRSRWFSAPSQRFRNHMTASQARAALPRRIWHSYARVAIHRDPWETAISRYYWRKAQTARGEGQAIGDFGQFVAATRPRLAANLRIAPLSGPDRVTHEIRYEHLAQDAKALGLGAVADRMRRLRAKADTRPPEATARKLYADHPDAARLIAEDCAELIAHLGYQSPV